MRAQQEARLAYNTVNRGANVSNVFRQKSENRKKFIIWSNTDGTKVVLQPSRVGLPLFCGWGKSASAAAVLLTTARHTN